MMTMKKVLAILTFTVKDEVEKEFNTWYDGYLTKILNQVPEFKTAARYISGTGEKNYSTVYTLESADAIKVAKIHLSSPQREKDVQEWHEWVEKGLSNVTWDIYEEVYEVENK